jgi:hypothetical protein
VTKLGIRAVEESWEPSSNRPRNDEIQLDLFLDYGRNHVPLLQAIGLQRFIAYPLLNWTAGGKKPADRRVVFEDRIWKESKLS